MPIGGKSPDRTGGMSSGLGGSSGGGRRGGTGAGGGRASTGRAMSDPHGLSSGANDGNKQTGMPPSLLNSKYPGATKKKTKSFEASLDNLKAVGTLVGDVLSGPAGLVKEGIAQQLGVGPLAGPGGALNPFSGQGPDVPSTGAGFADNNAKGALTPKPAERAAVQPGGIKKKKPAPPGFQLLQGAGGSLLGS